MVTHDVESPPGETTPLMASSGGAASGEAPPVVVLQELKAESLKEKAVSGVALVSFVTSLLTIVFQSAAHPIVWLSGLLGLVVSPTAAMQQHKLTQVEALQQTNEVLAAQVDQLTAENVRLSRSVQEMEESVLNLEAMEQTLEELQAVQGLSVEELERQLTESRDILQRMNTNTRGQVLQNLITVLLSADDEGDLVLDDDDIANMIHRLEGLHGINLDDEKLRTLIIDNGRSVDALMELARNVLSSNGDDAKNAIVSFLEDDEEEEKMPEAE